MPREFEPIAPTVRASSITSGVQQLAHGEEDQRPGCRGGGDHGVDGREAARPAAPRVQHDRVRRLGEDDQREHERPAGPQSGVQDGHPVALEMDETSDVVPQQRREDEPQEHQRQDRVGQARAGLAGRGRQVVHAPVRAGLGARALEDHEHQGRPEHDVHRRCERGADRLAEDGADVRAGEQLREPDPDERAGRDDLQQQAEDPLPGEVVARAEQVQRAIRVARGEHGRVAELGEHGPLGGLGLLALLGPGLGHVEDQGSQLAVDVLAGGGRERCGGRAQIARGEVGGHLRTPCP